MLASLLIVAQLAATGAPARPVLQFPEPGLDDSTAYAGYVTRFYRDANRNTLQLYLDRREARVVHLFANGENESIGFSARTADGRAAPVAFTEAPARVARAGRRAHFSWTLTSASRTLELGRFVLGSMRIERDVQYFKEHQRPFTDAPYALPEFVALLQSIAARPAAEQSALVHLLGAPSLDVLRARLRPSLTVRSATSATLVQPSLDAQDTLMLRIEALAGTTLDTASAQRVAVHGASPDGVQLRITVSTTGRALTPLTREEIFTADFLRWARSLPATDGRARWVARQITGVELLSSRDKLMAGLPTYATYFGRDMLVSTLMMQPIWRAEMNAFVISAALRKLAPNGEVSHEEALGGQALREAAGEAVTLFATADTARALSTRDSLRAQATRVLAARRATRENYHMVDDEYQLPLVIARYLEDPRLSDAAKRTYLRGAEGGRRRVDLLLASLAVVATKTAPYAQTPEVRHLVSFAPREPSRDTYAGEDRWFAQSWRDSGAGYGNGRYAMDINAIYVPQALRALQRVLGALDRLGFSAVVRALPSTPGAATAALARYAQDGRALEQAISTWDGAAARFTVRLSALEVRQAVAARLAAMPASDAAFWRTVPPTGAPLVFDALALDDAGAPIRVANSDAATRLFLDGVMGARHGPVITRDALLRDVALFARPYPEGLLVPGVGAVVANDAFARPAVWQAFDADAYHGPKVVWGREVNLFLLGVASQLPRFANDTDATAQLRRAADAVRDAVRASGFHSELWSYAVENGRVGPRRYGSGADVQLWSTTDLAVQYVWDRLGR